MDNIIFPLEISVIRGSNRTEIVLVIFENGEYLRVPIDLIYKYQLTKGVKLSEETYKILTKEIKIIKGKKYAFSICTKRSRVTKEVESLLRKKGYDNNEISEIMYFLKEFNLLNDSNYAKMAVNYYYTKKHLGIFRIRLELQKKGLSKEIIHKALIENGISENNDFEQAAKLIEKKKNYINLKSPDKKKLYIIQLLQRSGFNSSAIHKIIEKMKLESETFENYNDE